MILLSDSYAKLVLAIVEVSARFSNLLVRNTLALYQNGDT